MPNPRFSQPRAAYVHVPFCRHRCGYCNFTLVAGRDQLIEQYLLGIERELSGLVFPREVDTLFFGGGTPSHLKPVPLWKLLTVVRRWFQLADGHEFSVEANPLDLTHERIEVLRDGGVTRVSLGIQSFDERWLSVLERDHRPEEAQQSVTKALAAFPSVSVDLIFGVPGQTVEDWQLDLQAALQLAPHHLSVYGLTFERGAKFWGRLQRGNLVRCEEEAERDMYELAIDVLSEAGYEHYEVSNFAQPGHRCRHNEAYWTGRTYYAAGPGAARHIDGQREVNHRSTTTYLKRLLTGQSHVAEAECLTAEEAARERFVFGLRRLVGMNLDEFTLETGYLAESLFGDPLRRFLELGLLERHDGSIRLTRSGLLLSDSLWPKLLTPPVTLRNKVVQ